MTRRRHVSAGEMVRMNRAMWNDISKKWQVRQDGFNDWKFFRRGGNEFSPIVRRMMGPVRGKSLLDLQCGGGESSLSWANLGARATGVDMSEDRLGEARKKAVLAGVPATYVHGNVVRLPFRRNSFDRVYTGGGVTAWIPDIRRWGREIARVLRPGGRFVYNDSHPFLYCLAQKGRRLPTIGGHYFDQRPTVYMSMGHRGPRRLRQVERDWKLSDILNALAAAGLKFSECHEAPVGAMCEFRLSARYRRLLPNEIALRYDKSR